MLSEVMYLQRARLGNELGYVKNLTKPSDLRNPQFSSPEPMTKLQKFYLRVFGIPDSVKQQQARNIFSILEHIPFSSVLDIGCAHGQYSFQIATRWSKATVRGIDINENELKTANTAKVLFGIRNLTFEKSDLCSEPIQQGYDLALLLQVIEHLDDDISALRKIRSLLKEKGCLVITTANARSGIVTWIKRYVKLQRRDGYTLEELGILLHNSGFRIQQVRYLSSTIGGIVERFEKFVRINSAWLFSLVYPLLEALTFVDDFFGAKSALHASGILIVATAS